MVKILKYAEGQGEKKGERQGERKLLKKQLRSKFELEELDDELTVLMKQILRKLNSVMSKKFKIK